MGTKSLNILKKIPSGPQEVTFQADKVLKTSIGKNNKVNVVLKNYFKM